MLTFCSHWWDRHCNVSLFSPMRFVIVKLQLQLHSNSTCHEVECVHWKSERFRGWTWTLDPTRGQAVVHHYPFLFSFVTTLLWNNVDHSVCTINFNFVSLTVAYVTRNVSWCQRSLVPRSRGSIFYFRFRLCQGLAWKIFVFNIVVGNAVSIGFTVWTTQVRISSW